MNQNILPENFKIQFIDKLKIRFEKNMHRHKSLKWIEVEKKLLSNVSKLWILHEMEKTGGEPDVTQFDENTGEFIFVDCSLESPKGRRSLCYDKEGLESRKEHKPKNNAFDLAADMGVEMLTEEQYKDLQKLENFDTKTSSWLKTPKEIRELGGAIFGDFRYGKVFIYHNGAQSYYAARGFRALIRI